MKTAVIPFKTACHQSALKHPLNENQLTQIFVEQIEVKIKSNPYIGVKNQYSDTFGGTKGIPDFYFHKVEEGVHHLPLFVVEAKRLPAPTISREKEYVVGNSDNGGIERFKTGKHGKGLNECGMIGFVEKEAFTFWLQTINAWITGLSKTCIFWKNNETLVEIERKEDFMALKSVAHRTSQDDVCLHHIWIKIQ
ncbi:MAG: hypothetical protein LBQ73_02080 [Tannerellaceae bacterium]|nr:hypothetical protein [Tannerellaceae bacterium]